MSFRALKGMPVLRIFSVEKAREFYLDYLGFQVDFEHRFDERAPLFMQISPLLGMEANLLRLCGIRH